MQISEGTIIGKPKKEKIVAIDLIRAVCAIGVIIYHLSCYVSKEAPKVLYTHANGGFGVVFVAIFFMVSGGVLYLNYQKIDSLRLFYYKRWKTLFPMFYVAWSTFYLKNVFASGALFYHGKPLTILLSVFGVDGYFRYRGLNYYIIGEWFFGAIILLYALYPLFMKIVNKFGWKVLIPIIPLWIWQIETDIFKISSACNLIHCSSLFIIGMLIFKYNIYKLKHVIWPSLAVSLFLMFVKIPGTSQYKNIILSVALFFVLFKAGELLMKLPYISSGIAFVSSLTFPMFLVQNKVGSYIVDKFTPTTNIGMLKTIVLTLIICMLSGWCVKVVSEALLRTKWFGFIERFITTGKIKKEN